MADFEELRMTDLLLKLQAEVDKAFSVRSASQLKNIGARLQDVYNFHLTSQNSFSGVEENLKYLYSSFNYAAVITNDAVKSGVMGAEDMQTLNECLEIMAKCCRNAIEILKKS